VKRGASGEEIIHPLVTLGREAARGSPLMGSPAPEVLLLLRVPLGDAGTQSGTLEELVTVRNPGGAGDSREPWRSCDSREPWRSW